MKAQLNELKKDPIGNAHALSRLWNETWNDFKFTLYVGVKKVPKAPPATTGRATALRMAAAADAFAASDRARGISPPGPGGLTQTYRVQAAARFALSISPLESASRSY